MQVKFKKLKVQAHIPTLGSPQSAGYDLYACLDEDSLTIPPFGTRLCPTGLAIVPPNGYFAALFPRSGLSTKKGIRLANCVGVCDEDYRGEYMVALHNDTDSPKVVDNGERVAQLIFLPYQVIDFVEVNEIDETERGAGSFGSTGMT